MSMDVDVYIKATDEADAIAKCPASFRATVPDPADMENSTIDIWAESKPGEHVLVCIGPVMVTPPVLDSEGAVVTLAVMDTGFHMNVRCTQAIADAIDPSIKISAPATPKYIWAGD